MEPSDCHQGAIHQREDSGLESMNTPICMLYLRPGASSSSSTISWSDVFATLTLNIEKLSISLLENLNLIKTKYPMTKMINDYQWIEKFQ